ncbi:MAG: hypothetical protein SGJ10_10060 [Bacteroidota bacterium]|nr:hypothetical protein [Bacteroidota bacterium]
MKNINQSELYNSAYFTNPGGSFEAFISTRIRNKSKTAYKENQEFRIGFSSFGAFTKAMNGSKERSQRVDTLSSSSIGVLYIDSVTRTSHNLNYKNSQIRINGSYIFRTDTKRRFSFYTGFGFALGVSINSYTTIRTSVYSIKQSNRAAVYYYNGINGYYSYKEEVFKNKNTFSSAVYIPLGLDVRLGKYNESKAMTHLYFELRPSLEMIKIPELGTSTYDAMQVPIGVRLVI